MSATRTGTGNGLETVLVVDDDDAIVDLAETYLERSHLRVDVATATRPDDALSRIDEGVACVVSDYEMPGMDGVELLVELRARRPAVPFVLFTASDDPAIGDRVRELGGTVLRKNGQAGAWERLVDRVETALTEG